MFPLAGRQTTGDNHTSTEQTKPDPVYTFGFRLSVFQSKPIRKVTGLENRLTDTVSHAQQMNTGFTVSGRINFRLSRNN